MSNKPFVYQDPFPLKKDDTEYYLLSSDYVSVAEFAGQEVLKVEPQALTLLAQHAFHDASFMLRPAHQQQVADILNDPEASENDKYVALQFLRNSDIAAKGVLPTCQDTGTAIITGKKGQRVWTGGGDEAALAQGVYNTYIQDNLRYSQNAPLDMYKEVNTGTNLPAQTDACHKHGGFYLGSIGGPAAVLAQQSIRSLECVAYPELGMEAIWKIEVEDFPAFILVDDKGNDFFQQIQSSQCARCVK
ncbi:hypothetical protein DMP75_04460 [Klebsiella michiganensis]|nr:hypothetical protein DMP75_04460 [Klebsiella michiganensis]